VGLGSLSVVKHRVSLKFGIALGHSISALAQITHRGYQGEKPPSFLRKPPS